MRATCLTAPDDGVQPALLLSIPKQRQRVLGHAAPAQYLFNVPEGFSRLVLEHRVRPSAGLRAVCALSTHPEALGGWGGLLMRLKQDGHGQVDVIGPSGLGTELVQVGAFVKWRHPQVHVREIQGTAQRSASSTQQTATALAVPAGCSLSEQVQSVPAECCYEDELVRIMALKPNQPYTSLPDWLLQQPATQPSNAAAGGDSSDSSSTSSSDDSSSSSSDDDSESVSGSETQPQQPAPQVQGPQLAQLSGHMQSSGTSSSSDSSEDTSSTESSSTTSDDSCDSSSDSGSDGADEQPTSDRFSALDELFLASSQRQGLRGGVAGGKGGPGRGRGPGRGNRGSGSASPRAGTPGRSGAARLGSVLHDPSRQQLLQALSGVSQASKDASAVGSSQAGQASKGQQQQGASASATMDSDVPVLGYLCCEQATGHVLVVLSVPSLAVLDTAQGQAVVAALTDKQELRSKVTAMVHFSPAHVVLTQQYQTWLHQLPGRQVVFHQHTLDAHTPDGGSVAALAAPTRPEAGTSTSHQVEPPAAVVASQGALSSASKQLGFHASARVLCRLQLLNSEVFPLPAPLAHLTTPDLAALPADSTVQQQPADQPQVAATAHMASAQTATDAHVTHVPDCKPDSTAVPQSTDMATISHQVHQSVSSVTLPTQPAEQQAVEVPGRIVHASLLWQLCSQPTASSDVAQSRVGSGAEGGCRVLAPASDVRLDVEQLWREMLEGEHGLQLAKMLKDLKTALSVLHARCKEHSSEVPHWQQQPPGDHPSLHHQPQHLHQNHQHQHHQHHQHHYHHDHDHHHHHHQRHPHLHPPTPVHHAPPAPPPVHLPPPHGWASLHPPPPHHHYMPGAPPAPPPHHLPHTHPWPTHQHHSYQHPHYSPHPQPPPHPFPHVPPHPHPHAWLPPGHQQPGHQSGCWGSHNHPPPQGPAHAYHQPPGPSYPNLGHLGPRPPPGAPPAAAAPPPPQPGTMLPPTSQAANTQSAVPPPEKRPRLDQSPPGAAAGHPSTAATPGHENPASGGSNQLVADRLRQQLRGKVRTSGAAEPMPNPPTPGTQPAAPAPPAEEHAMSVSQPGHVAPRTQVHHCDAGGAAAAAGAGGAAAAAGAATGQHTAQGSNDEWCAAWLTDAPACVRSPAAQHTRVTFLGTGSAEPSKYRGPSAILIQFNERLDTVLLDCGEGTWGAMVRTLGEQGAKQQVAALRCLWCSHRHADHCLGLPGLLAARPTHAPPLLVAGPHDLKPWLQHLNKQHGYKTHFVHCRQFSSQRQVRPSPDQGNLTFLQESLLGCGPHGLGLVSWCSVPVQHCSDAYGVVLQHRDGWKIVYSGDTRPCQALAQAGAGATLLIHEATFEQALLQQALNKRHSTSIEALEMARRMQAYRTILTHFSQRYPRVPAGLGLTEDSEDEGECAGVAAVEHQEAGCNDEACMDGDDECCRGQEGADDHLVGARLDDEGAAKPPRLPPAAADVAVRTSAIAFDGMTVRLSDTPWLPLLGPYMDRVLKSQAAAAEQ